MLGNFDIAQLWYHGPASVTVFLVATVICHICLLNLLIAIVSNEFDEYMLSAGWPITVIHAKGMWSAGSHAMQREFVEHTVLTITIKVYDYHGTSCLAHAGAW